MWTEGGPLRQMRAALRAQLPTRAFLKRDRGDALFITNAPAFDPALRELPGFIAERRGALMAVLPDAGWVARLERRCPEPPDELSASLLRFRGQAPDRENLVLFARGAKLLDAPGAASAAEIGAFDRALRQRAALALRGGCGGALYAASVLNARIRQRYAESKEMKP